MEESRVRRRKNLKHTTANKKLKFPQKKLYKIELIPPDGLKIIDESFLFIFKSSQKRLIP